MMVQQFACHEKGQSPSISKVFCRKGPCPGKEAQVPKCPAGSDMYQEGQNRGVCIEEEDLIHVPHAVEDATHRPGRCPGVMYHAGCNCNACR
eukprot:symbB.v1.2.034349.t1/scaffold4418.1/size39897/5